MSLTQPSAGLAASKPSRKASLRSPRPVVFGRLHVLPIVIAFLTANPKVTARMLLVDRVVDLVEEGLDIGIRIGNLAELPSNAGLASWRDPLCGLR